MKRKVMVLFLATLILSLAIIAAPVAASGNSEFRITPPTDKPGPGCVYTPVEVIYITCLDGQVQSYVAYGASTVPLY